MSEEAIRELNAEMRLASYWGLMCDGVIEAMQGKRNGGRFDIRKAAEGLVPAGAQKPKSREIVLYSTQM